MYVCMCVRDCLVVYLECNCIVSHIIMHVASAVLSDLISRRLTAFTYGFIGSGFAMFKLLLSLPICVCVFVV